MIMWLILFGKDTTLMMDMRICYFINLFPQGLKTFKPNLFKYGVPRYYVYRLLQVDSLFE